MPPEFDEHILSTMTDEERATILEQQTPEEIAAIAAIANGDEDGPDDDDEDEGDDKGTADPAAAATPATAGATTAAPAADPAPANPSASDTFQPSYQAKLPDDFAAQESAIKEKNDTLAARF